MTSMAQLPRIGPKGAVWVMEMLRSGLSLGKRVAELVDPNGLQIWAVVGVEADAAAPSRLQQDDQHEEDTNDNVENG